MAKDIIARGLAIFAKDVADLGHYGLSYRGSVADYSALPDPPPAVEGKINGATYNTQKEYTDASGNVFPIGLYVYDEYKAVSPRWYAITLKGEDGDPGEITIVDCHEADSGTLTFKEASEIKELPHNVEFEFKVKNVSAETIDAKRYKYQYMTNYYGEKKYYYMLPYADYNATGGTIKQYTIEAIPRDGTNGTWRRYVTTQTNYVSTVRGYLQPALYPANSYAGERIIAAKDILRAGSNITIDDNTGTISATGELAAEWGTLVGKPTDNTEWNNEMAANWQPKLSDGSGTIVNGTAIDAVMGYGYTTNVAVGNLPAGTEIKSTDKIVDILFKILNNGVIPVQIYVGGSGSAASLTNPTFTDINNTLLPRSISETDLVGQHKWNISVGEAGGPSRYCCIVLPKIYTITKWTAADSTNSIFVYDFYSIEGTSGIEADYKIWYIPSYTWSYPDGTDYYITITK